MSRSSFIASDSTPTHLHYTITINWTFPLHPYILCLTVQPQSRVTAPKNNSQQLQPLTSVLVLLLITTTSMHSHCPFLLLSVSVPRSSSLPLSLFLSFSLPLSSTRHSHPDLQCYILLIQTQNYITFFIVAFC